MADIRPAKKFAFDVGWVFAGSMAGLVLNFLKKPVMARYLGAEGLGLFSLVTMIAGVVTLIASLGFNSAIVKYAAQYKDDKNRLNAIVSSGIVTMAIIGAFASIILFAVSNTLANVFDMPSLSFLLKIYAVIFPFSLIFGVLLALFNGLREMKFLTFIDILNKTMIFSFILILLFLGFGVVGALIGDMMALFVVVVIATVIMKKFVRFTHSNYKENTKMLASFGSRIMGVNSINLIQYQADSFLIGYFLTAADLGYYTAAISLSRFFWRVPQSIQTVSYPTTSEYWAKGKYDSLNKMIEKSMKYSAYILLPIGLAIWFFAKDIITFLFGYDFLPAVLPLQILLIGMVVNGITTRPLGGFLPGTGRPGLSLVIVSISSSVNILLNVLLIPFLGITGAAIATTISFITISALNLLFIVKTPNIRVNFKWLIKMSGICLILFLVFISFREINRYLVGGLVLVTYIFIVSKFLFAEDDREFFKSLISELINKFK